MDRIGSFFSPFSSNESCERDAGSAESEGVMTFGVAQLMHKEERGDVAWTISFMHIHQPKNPGD